MTKFRNSHGCTLLIKCNSAVRGGGGGGGSPQAGLTVALIACVLPAILQGHDLLKNMDPVYKLIWQKCFDLGGQCTLHTACYLESTPLLSHAIPHI